MELSVNVDHIATLREARKEDLPDPVYAAVEAELAGADGITVHLRADRRHIKERDLRVLKDVIKTELNLEMAATPEMVKTALAIKPYRVTLVPESAGEVTTQGGLDLLHAKDDLRSVISRLKDQRIRVGIFIDPDIEQVKEAVRAGAQYIEINTSEYSKQKNYRNALIQIARAVKAARREGFTIHAGHGIDYRNIQPLLRLQEISGYSIGFAIVARAVFVGMRQATQEMVSLIKGAR